MLEQERGITGSDDPLKRSLEVGEQNDLSPTAMREYWGAGRITAEDLGSLRELHAEFRQRDSELTSQFEEAVSQSDNPTHPASVQATGGNQADENRQELIEKLTGEHQEQRQNLIVQYMQDIAPITDRYTTAGVGYTPSPVSPTQPDFIEMAAAHYIEAPSPEIFERIACTLAQEYFTVQEDAVIEMIGSHVDLAAFQEEESPALRRMLLLDAVRPMVEHAEGMPEWVKTNFMAVLHSYGTNGFPKTFYEGAVDQTGQLTEEPVDIYLDIRENLAKRLEPKE